MATVIPTKRISPQRGTIWLGEGPEPGEISFNASIPLAPFDSGISYVEQPEHTEISINTLRLPIDSVSKLDGLQFTPADDDEHGSIYLGGAHNPIQIQQIAFRQTAPRAFTVEAVLYLDFASEGVGESSTITLVCELDLG